MIKETKGKVNYMSMLSFYNSILMVSMRTNNPMSNPKSSEVFGERRYTKFLQIISLKSF